MNSKSRMMVLILMLASATPAGLVSAQAHPAIAFTTFYSLVFTILQPHAVVAGGAISSGATSAVSTTTTWVNSAEKQALARESLEDAAVYYETGTMTGILPQVVEHVRSLSDEQVQYSDREIVDALVEASGRLLAGE